MEWALDLLAKVAGGAGLVGLFYQFSREKDLAEADFSLRINSGFITNDRIRYIYIKLEKSKEDNQKVEPFDDDDLIDIADYLSFFEPFWELVYDGLVEIKTIDILAYRFFLATNNKFVQQRLLCRPGKEDAWKAIYHLHREWRNYRLKNNLQVWQEEYDLSRTPAYAYEEQKSF